MAFKSLLFHLITAVVAINLIFADEEAERFFPFFSFFGGGGNGSGGLSNLPFFGDLSPVSSFFESRQERSADLEESDEEDQQGRFGFGIVACNYTTQGGTRCVNCTTSLTCYPNNVGQVRTCAGFLRYCNNGRCSSQPGPACTSSGSSNSSSTNSTG